MSPELKGRQLLNIIGAMSLWVSLKRSTTGYVIEDTDHEELKVQQSSSMCCNMAAIKKKIFNLHSSSVLSARFTLFWFWPKPITTHETDIQKWLWLVTSQTYCACSCCNSTAQARHYGQLLVLLRLGLVTGCLGGVPFHLRSLVNPPTTTKGRKKETETVCWWKFIGYMCVRGPKQNLLKLLNTPVMSNTVLQHCEQLTDPTLCTNSQHCYQSIFWALTKSASHASLHQGTMCYGSCSPYGVLDWYGS